MESYSVSPPQTLLDGPDVIHYLTVHSRSLFLLASQSVEGILDSAKLIQNRQSSTVSFTCRLTHVLVLLPNRVFSVVPLVCLRVGGRLGEEPIHHASILSVVGLIVVGTPDVERICLLNTAVNQFDSVQKTFHID